MALVGCGGDDAGVVVTTAPPAGEVSVWFSDDQGVLRAEARPLPAGAEPLEAALAALEEGPADPALLPALPPGARILGAGVADGVATVDLSAEFESAYPPGGAAAELAVVGPLVRTASEASGAPRVRLLVEGRAPAPTGTQFDFAEPFAPGDLPAP
jgi:spore germination protein GerM